MHSISALAIALFLGVAAVEEGERELVTELPVETLDYVVATSLDARSSEGFLKALFKQLAMRPRYRIAVFPLPGEEKPHLIFIRGKEKEVRLVKKALAAMEEAASLPPPADEGPFIMRLDLREVSAAEMRKRLIGAASRAGLPLAAGDFLIYPEGPRGALFFIGSPKLASRITEMSRGLDRAEPAEPPGAVESYFRAVGEEFIKASGALVATVLSALGILIIHLVIGRLPLLGSRYRRSFRVFWEKLFAAFRGKDLAWEIIQAAAGLGVASSGLAVAGGETARAAAPGERRGEREKAVAVASDYIRWRGLEADRPEVRRLLEAAIDAEVARAVSSRAAGA